MKPDKPPENLSEKNDRSFKELMSQQTIQANRAIRAQLIAQLSTTLKQTLNLLTLLAPRPEEETQDVEA